MIGAYILCLKYFIFWTLRFIRVFHWPDLFSSLLSMFPCPLKRNKLLCNGFATYSCQKLWVESFSCDFVIVNCLKEVYLCTTYIFRFSLKKLCKNHDFIIYNSLVWMFYRRKGRFCQHTRIFKYILKLVIKLFRAENSEFKFNFNEALISCWKNERTQQNVITL